MKTPLQHALGRFQSGWRIGLLCLGLFTALLVALAALAGFGGIDYFAGFDDASRHLVASAVVIIGLAAVFAALVETFSFDRRAAAREADRALDDPRRSLVSALELSETAEPGTPLARWLRGRAIESAAARLKEPPKRTPIRRRLVRLLVPAALLLALLLVVRFAAPEAFSVVARRLLQPDVDVPPYTPLRFTLDPPHPVVLYGGDLVVTAEIAGGEIAAPVRLLTRDPATGHREESPAYRETGARYSQHLEKISAPVEIAFAVGRARSAWLPIQVRTQPKVQEAILTVEPPAYTRLPRREFAVGTQPLAVLAGSRITARVSSNRPLSTGGLQLIAGGVAPQQVASETEGANRLRFTWVARQGARLGLTVRDVLGTASEVLEFEQKLVPDERPTISLREPVGDVLATTDSELPLEYAASDDLGLSRLALVRRLGGYRERALSEPVTPGSRRQEVLSKLSLAPFGLVPGQTIELSVEAADTNPTLLGVAVSEPSRIHIISREAYAEKLRRQTTLEDFTARYEAIDQALDEARKALAELEKAAATGDAKKTEEARQKALAAHQNAAKLFGEIAKDFPIFSLDEKLSAAAGDVMKKLFENAQDLEGLKDEPADEMARTAPELRKRLGEAEGRIAEDLKRGERAAKAAAIFDLAERFKELVQLQREVVKDLDRIVEAVRRGEMTAAQALPEMEQRQQAVAGGLDEFERNLSAALEQLPAEFQKLRAGTEQFLEAYRETPIPPVMREGAAAAARAEGPKADARAGEALALLEALLKKKNAFCQLCQGEGEGEAEWPEDLASTMRELLDALIPKPGGDGDSDGDEPGEGRGSHRGRGAGPGGHSDSGYSMRGRMPQLPVYGPNRMRLNRSGSGGLGKDGREGGRAPGAGVVERDRGAVELPRQAAGESVAVEAVPEAYREAVKRYFLPGAANPNSTSKNPP